MKMELIANDRSITGNAWSKNTISDYHGRSGNGDYKKNILGKSTCLQLLLDRLGTFQLARGGVQFVVG